MYECEEEKKNKEIPKLGEKQKKIIISYSRYV